MAIALIISISVALYSSNEKTKIRLLFMLIYSEMKLEPKPNNTKKQKIYVAKNVLDISASKKFLE